MLFRCNKNYLRISASDGLQILCFGTLDVFEITNFDTYLFFSNSPETDEAQQRALMPHFLLESMMQTEDKNYMRNVTMNTYS